MILLLVTGGERIGLGDSFLAWGGKTGGWRDIFWSWLQRNVF